LICKDIRETVVPEVLSPKSPSIMQYFNHNLYFCDFQMELLSGVKLGETSVFVIGGIWHIPEEFGYRIVLQDYRQAIMPVVIHSCEK